MIQIGFVGDIALTHSYEALYGAKGPRYPFERIRPVLDRHDLMVGNLEAPLCLGGETYPEKVSLRAHPGYAAGLRQAGFGVMTLANNHILDYRDQAFYDTIGLLDTQGIAWCGAGDSLDEALRPAVLERQGVVVGVLSRCEVKIDSPFYAAPGERGIAPLDMDELEVAIASLKERAHVIAVCLHWGREDWRYPFPGQVEAARRIVDMGADLVVGHHPHVLQGVERYGRGYIAYSLGNFLFSDLDWRWVDGDGRVRRSVLKIEGARRYTAVLSAQVSAQGVHGVSLTGCVNPKSLQVVPIGNPRSFDARMRLLSAPIALSRYELFYRVYDLLHTGLLRLAYNARRSWKAYRLLPALGRGALRALPPARAALGARLSKVSLHKNRAGAKRPAARPRPPAGEDENGAKSRGGPAGRPGIMSVKLESLGLLTHKKRDTVLT